MLAQNVQFNQKAVDLGGRGDLSVNPTTLALELQIPLGNYPGRAGLNVPVSISYSSKLWRVNYYSYIPGPYSSSGNPTGPGYTRVEARYAEHSSAGWTSSLGFPFFDNTPIQYYDIDGAPKPDANSCGSSGCYIVDRVLVWMPDGSSHELRSTDQPIAAGSGGPLADDLYAVDGSRIRYQRSTQTLFMPDGGRYLFAARQYVDRNGNTLTYEASNNRWVDTLGRGISLPPLATTPGAYNYSLPGVGGAGVNYTFVWKNLGDPGVLSNGQSPRYVADSGCPIGTGSYSPSLFQSDVFGTRTCIQNAGGIFNPVVLYQVQLPTGQSYTFNYNVYGEIDRVQLPTGGYERYEYAQNAALSSMNFPYTQANRGVLNRFVSTGAGAAEAQWHYEGGGIVSITAPDNTLVERYLYIDSSSSWSYSANGARAGSAFDERTYSPPDSGGVRHMLRRTLTEWSMTGSNAVGLVGVNTANRNPRVTKRVEILLDTGAGNALAKTTVYGYDTTYQFSTGVNQTSASEYDYAAVDQNTAQTGSIGSIPLPSQPLRITETAYLDGNASYRSKNILGLPTSITVKKDATTIVAQTTINYDESAYQLGNTYGSVTQWAAPSGVRGNPTTVNRWLDTAGAYVQVHTQYDQCGSAVAGVDANGRQTQFVFSSTYAYAYPTSVTTPAPNPDAVSYTSGGTTYNLQAGTFGSTAGLTTYTSYDFNTGRTTSTTDANGKTASFDYTDPLNRLKSITRPDGGVTTYIYDRSMNAGVVNDYVRTLSSLDSSRSVDSYQFFDGLGRPSRTFFNEGGSPAVFITSDTQYDAMGRAYRVSSPYRTNGSGQAINPSNRWVTTAYDDLGRVKSVTTSDGAVVTTSHVGNTATVTDQAGKKRSSTSDALGRMTQATEDPTAGGLNYVTTYTYDALDNLRKVDQGGQVRFFMYDSLSRLIRTKNPEQAAGSVASNITDPLTGNAQWSLAYGYDSNGNMTARVDARGVTTNYFYDYLNRNIITAYTTPAGSGVAATPDVRRTYDNPAAGVNGIGRPFWVHAVGSSVTVFDSYDAAGHPTQQHQSYWVNNNWGQPFVVARTYDKAGNVVSQTYPSGRVVTYGYDAAGRVANFAGNLGDGVQRTYSTGINYGEFGGIQQEQFGTQTPLYRKLHYNERGQLYDMRLSSVAWATDQWNWNRGMLVNHYGSGDFTTWGTSGTNNNGNVLRSHHYVPNDDQVSGYTVFYQDYEYDGLNRLTKVTEANSITWTAQYVQKYEYDRWGNRTINAGVSWGAPEPQFELSPATNQEVAEPSNRIYAPGDSARAPAQKLMRYDLAGNLTYDSYTGQGARVYDAENRMTQAQDTAQGLSSYTYDAEGRRVKRLTANQETWQVYGMSGELLGEYQSGAAPFVASKEYGYRGGELLVVMSSGDVQRMTRFIKNLYYNCLARDPSPTDLQQKTDQLAQAGAQGGAAQLLSTARSIARGLFESTEYVARNRTNTQYVTDLYNAYLQRAPDATGLSFWVQDAQNNGRAHTLTSFEVSAEFATMAETVYGTSQAGDNQRVDHFIDEFYLGAYNSFPTTAQRQQQEQRLNNAAALGQQQVKAEARLMGAEIFQATGYNSTHSDSQYVTDLYEAFLQRAPDGLGLSFWISKVQNEGRASALAGFQNSTEFGELAGTLYRETFWLVPDNLGTPRMVVDKSGSLAGIKRHDYLPFGEEVGAGVGGRATTQGYGAVDNVRQEFAKKERDAETGLDYFGARYYCASEGRFISTDPVNISRGRIVNPQRWNLYVFVVNNPVNLYDPDGRQDKGTGGGKTIDVFLAFHGSDRVKKEVEARIGSAGGAKIKVHGFEESTGKNIIKSLQRAGGATIIVGHSDRGDEVTDKKGRPIDRWSGEAIRVYDGYFGANKTGFGFDSTADGRYQGFGKINAELVAVFACALAQRTEEGFRNSLSSPSAAYISNDGGDNGLTQEFMDIEFAIAAALVTAEGGDADDVAERLQSLNDNTYHPPDSNATDQIKVLRNGALNVYDAPMQRLPRHRQNRRNY